MRELRSGTRIGGWVVDHVLAYGDPALVAAHRVTDPQQRATLTVAEEKGHAVARQQRELDALRSLDHPRIPKVLDARKVDGMVTFAMRSFSGDSLSDRLVGGTLDERQTIVWLFELASALQHVHTSGWAHRAVHPQNIFVAPRHQLWLMGFEHAVRLEEVRALDRLPDAAMAYVAPEVLRDPDHDPVRADLYAYGLVAYEALSGEPAFPAAAWAERADRERTLLEWKTRARELDPGPEHPDWLRSLVRKCTHPIAEQRLPDMDAVVSWLDASRAAWELPELRGTPVAVPREELPPLQVESSLQQHQEQLYLWRRAQLEQQAANRTMMVFVAGALGCVAGVAVSALVVLMTELAKLG
jgi:serine/threonine protein kinase